MAKKNIKVSNKINNKEIKFAKFPKKKPFKKTNKNKKRFLKRKFIKRDAFYNWRRPNPRTGKERLTKRVKRLRLKKREFRVSRIVNKRFRLRKGLFVTYYYGLRRFFRKVQFFRKSKNFIILKKTANNFFITVFERSGKMLFYRSAGMLKLKGPRRSTSEAAEDVVKDVCKRLKREKIKDVGVIVKSYKNYVIRAAIARLNKIYKADLNSLILIMIPRSHNGIRGRKIKRG